MTKLPSEPLELINHLVFPGSCNGPSQPKRPAVFLPAFQRDAVWQPSQVCELWDSLLRGIPLPSLVLAPVCKTQDSTGKKIHREWIASRSGRFLAAGRAAKGTGTTCRI